VIIIGRGICLLQVSADFFFRQSSVLIEILLASIAYYGPD
jgi:hypothetical protein